MGCGASKKESTLVHEATEEIREGPFRTKFDAMITARDAITEAMTETPLEGDALCGNQPALVILRNIAWTFVSLLRKARRVDGVGRPKFDFHTGDAMMILKAKMMAGK